MALNKYSITDYLKSQGQDSSYAARKKLASQYGIGDYSGTASQNTNLLNSLRGGKSPTSSVPENTGVKQENSPESMDYKTPYIETEYGPGYGPGYGPSTGSSKGGMSPSYNSPYSGQIESILSSIMDGDKFSYDMNNDQLYQQYKESYMRQGNLAMRDTMGAASALSGGYGNTYAQTAGSQAYDGYIGQLNDRIPELYQLAYNQYKDEKGDMYNQLNALSGLENVNYGQYQDALSQQNWQSQFEYQKGQDSLSQQNWQTEFEYQKQQDALAHALAQQKLYAGSSSTGKAKEKVSKTTDKNMYIKMATDYLNKTDDNNEHLYDSGYIIEMLYDKGLTETEIKDIIKKAGGNYQTGMNSLKSQIR